MMPVLDSSIKSLCFISIYVGSTASAQRSRVLIANREPKLAISIRFRVYFSWGVSPLENSSASFFSSSWNAFERSPALRLCKFLYFFKFNEYSSAFPSVRLKPMTIDENFLPAPPSVSALCSAPWLCWCCSISRFWSIESFLEKWFCW